MTELKPPKTPIQNWEAVRDEWVQAVESLVSEVEGWCKANDWPTRRIDKKVTDLQLGDYILPVLLIQADLAKVMLEPLARFAAWGDGLVDLYLMPAYDDIARLVRIDGNWQMYFQFQGEPPMLDLQAATPRQFDQQAFLAVMGEMIRHAGT